MYLQDFIKLITTTAVFFAEALSLKSLIWLLDQDATWVDVEVDSMLSSFHELLLDMAMGEVFSSVRSN